MGPKEVTEDTYLIGGSDISDSRDCSVYLLNLGELVLIDTGAGPSANKIIQNIEKLGFDPERISTVILTHCHIDHVGGAQEFRKRFGSRIVMHEIDAEAVERGDSRMTAAYWYGVNFAPLAVDVRLTKEEEKLTVSDQEIVCLHTPGHTPGSISAYLDRGGKRILFGQDIHGPFLAEFGANMSHWQKSMEKLLALKADILCEGHFGVYQPNEKVTEYIERYVEEYGE
ncbi:MAG: MBL fold metallo-hydrolase [Proteobacteria bacterium]|nr:MBL fold metallo-hydrolase [Pseudomonadota bacterium]